MTVSLGQLVQDLDLQTEGDVAGEIAAICVDSREVQSGSLFAAMAGSCHDGAAFIPEAVKGGASVVLCAPGIDRSGFGDISWVISDRPRKALARIASRFYGSPEQQLELVGITGTNGKTTTAHLCRAVLESQERPAAALGTLGIEYGKLPGRAWQRLNELSQGLSLTTPGPVMLMQVLRELLDVGVKRLIMEVSSHALEQERVAAIDFDVAVCTNLSRDHLDYHGSMEAYGAAKERLFSERLKPTGVAICNADDEYCRGLGERLRSRAGSPDVLFYGHRSDADISVEAVDVDDRATAMRVGTPLGELSFSLSLPGEFNVSNALAAVAVGVAANVEPGRIETALSGVSAPAGRMERVSGVGEPLVVVDYAHTPDALARALGSLRPAASDGFLRCVFGCGGDRDAGKRAPMGKAVGELADFAVLTNDNPRNEDPQQIASAVEVGLSSGSTAWEVELDRAAAIRRAVLMSGRGDVVLIAGKGHEAEQLVAGVASRFDDREHARAALLQWRGEWTK